MKKVLAAFLLVIAMVLSACGDSEPKYDSMAQAYSHLYIEQNYYSDAKFDYTAEKIIQQDKRVKVSGKFTHNNVPYTYCIIGEFPYSNTDEYHIQYVAINNKILYDKIG